MGISFFNLKKWFKMFFGKSVLHVNQNLGVFFDPNSVHGYFNNMIDKVTSQSEIIGTEKVPELKIESGDYVIFPVAVFQYGLGAYDLFLKTNDERYLEEFIKCADWSIDNQEESGAWNNFFYIFPEHPYGAMCQGEGVSLLIRAYKHTQKEHYLLSAKKAIDFMVKPIEEGGTADYKNNEVIFKEYVHRSIVLNGWIFAIFGLYDYMLVSDEYKELVEVSFSSLIAHLKDFDNGYWSLYSLDKKVASPFYHSLHIAQLQAIYLVTGDSMVKDIKEKFERYQKSKSKKSRALIVKSVQKIFERI